MTPKPDFLDRIVAALLSEGRHVMVHDGAAALTPRTSDAALIERAARQQLRRTSVTLYVTQPGNFTLDGWIGLMPRRDGGISATHSYVVGELVDRARREVA